MALIGTVSGSNGTSTTAISGSLLIADEPLSRFPTLMSGVKLFVSGAKSAIGADSPSAIFGGDTFVSGAFGTDSYIQMKSVGTLAIPTNTTASYIYTSGSTNDLYFTQYQPGTGYTNTTRLRWLESSLSTGLLHGGVLSTENGTTTFSITSGSGIIVNYNASTANEPYPTITTVDWPAYVSSSLPNITTTEITYIAIDSTGALFKQNTAYTDGDFESKIVIGRVLHQNGSVTNGTITSPTVAYGQTGFRGDFIRAFGPLKLSGHVVSVNATATNPPTNTQFLGLAKTAGDSYVEGRNYTTNPDSPNYVKSTTDTALTTSKIYREYVNSSGVPVIDTGAGGAGYAAIDVTNYNNAGTLTVIGSGNNFTIQRLYWFPNSVNRAIFAYYGGVIYPSIAAAEVGIQSEVFTEGDNTRDAAIFLGYLIVKEGATDLGNPTQAKLVQAGICRAISSTGGVGSTAPGGSNLQIQYNNASAFTGSSNLWFNPAVGLYVTGSVIASGEITGSNERLSGNLAVNGGFITTTAGSFNLINSTATTLNIGGAATNLNIGAAGGVMKVKNPVAVPGADVSLFVSGSINGKGTSGVSVFGGDTFISGSLFDSDSQKVVGAQSFSIFRNVPDPIDLNAGSPGDRHRIFSGSAGDFSVTNNGTSFSFDYANGTLQVNRAGIYKVDISTVARYTGANTVTYGMFMSGAINLFNSLRMGVLSQNTNDTFGYTFITSSLGAGTMNIIPILTASNPGATGANLGSLEPGCSMTVIKVG